MAQGERRTPAIHDENFRYHREKRDAEQADRERKGAVIQEALNRVNPGRYRIDKGWVPIAMGVDLDDLYQLSLALLGENE